jgi:hypothetical protein
MERRLYDGVGPAFTQQGIVVGPDGSQIGQIGMVIDAELADLVASRSEFIAQETRTHEKCALHGKPDGSTVRWGPMLRHEKFAFESGLPVQ